MTVMREHEIKNGRVWKTMGEWAPYVVVPVLQLEGMSPEEVGEAVIGLQDEAHVSYVRDMFCYVDEVFHPLRQGEDEIKRYRNICISLNYEFAGGLFNEVFYQAERLRDLDIEIKARYEDFCILLDGTYNYLSTKKSRLTPGQEMVKAIIVKLRHGCSLCGHLGGNHSQACVKISKAESGKESSSPAQVK